MNYNSSKNQRIKDKFVGIHVYCNVNVLMDSYWKDDENEYFEDIENLMIYTCPKCGESQKDWQDFESEDSNYQYQCPDCKEYFDDEIDEHQEILEWWAVSNWLYEKLKENGYPVLDCGNTYIWGRCTSGQAISLDYSISEVCENMGILEGQESEWYKGDN